MTHSKASLESKKGFVAEHIWIPNAISAINVTAPKWTKELTRKCPEEVATIVAWEEKSRFRYQDFTKRVIKG